MIHIISEKFFIEHKSDKLKKIIIEEAKFININSKFFMKDGICFIYLKELGFLIVPENSELDQHILEEDVDFSCWFIEKYNKSRDITKNFINAHPHTLVYENTDNEWLTNYSGYIRLWNTYTKEDFIIYKSEPVMKFNNNPKSYLCRFVLGSKFPINLKEVNELNNLIIDVLEWK